MKATPSIPSRLWPVRVFSTMSSSTFSGLPYTKSVRERWRR